LLLKLKPVELKLRPRRRSRELSDLLRRPRERRLRRKLLKKLLSELKELLSLTSCHLR
jgi:hypothetical protein